MERRCNTGGLHLLVLVLACLQCASLVQCARARRLESSSSDVFNDFTDSEHDGQLMHGAGGRRLDSISDLFSDFTDNARDRHLGFFGNLVSSVSSIFDNGEDLNLQMSFTPFQQAGKFECVMMEQSFIVVIHRMPSSLHLSAHLECSATFKVRAPLCKLRSMT